MTYLARFSKDNSPGTYEPVSIDGVMIVWFRCPDCGDLGILDHEVDEAGNVSPSVECANDLCSFHDSVQLADCSDTKQKRQRIETA